MNRYVITASPHIRNKANTAFLMNTVSISLIPASIGGLLFLAGKYYSTSIDIDHFCSLTEGILQKLLKKPLTWFDGSAALTGFLLALCCPPAIPLWLPAIGSVFAIFSKQVFGGLGQNPFNPALIGRAFMVLSFPVYMTSWLKPFEMVTSSTPLAVYAENGGMQAVLELFHNSSPAMYKALFLGLRGGCIGEVFIPGLLIGLSILLLTKTINWYIPVTYVGSVFLLSWLLGMDPLFSILSGGVLFGAFFMATDYVTSPMLPVSKLIYGFGCGFINVIIRFFANMPEGTTFAILLMNIVTPILDKRIKKPVGYQGAVNE